MTNNERAAMEARDKACADAYNRVSHEFRGAACTIAEMAFEAGRDYERQHIPPECAMDELEALAQAREYARREDNMNSWREAFGAGWRGHKAWAQQPEERLLAEVERLRAANAALRSQIEAVRAICAPRERTEYVGIILAALSGETAQNGESE